MERHPDMLVARTAINQSAGGKYYLKEMFNNIQCMCFDEVFSSGFI